MLYYKLNRLIQICILTVICCFCKFYISAQTPVDTIQKVTKYDNFIGGQINANNEIFNIAVDIEILNRFYLGGSFSYGKKMNERVSIIGSIGGSYTKQEYLNSFQEYFEHHFFSALFEVGARFTINPKNKFQFYVQPSVLCIIPSTAISNSPTSSFSTIGKFSPGIMYLVKDHWRFLLSFGEVSIRYIHIFSPLLNPIINVGFDLGTTNLRVSAEYLF